MKPLYIFGQSPVRIRLDGPALKISTEDAAARLYPLRRVSRVVVSGDVGWETNALLACADAGITVSFLQPDGAPRARLMGRAGERDLLAQRLSDFLDRPDAVALYTQWSQAVSRREARLCAWRLRLPLEANNRTIAQVVRRRLATQWDLRAVRRAERRMRGLLSSAVLARLREQGLDRELELLPALPRDIVSMVAWCLYPELLRWAGSRARRARSQGRGFELERRALVQFFESHSRAVEQALARLLNHLHRWLVELQ